MKIEFSDGSVFRRDADLNPNREKDGRFGHKASTLTPHQSAKNRLSNLKSELKRMEAGGKATPEMLEKKRKSVAGAESVLKGIEDKNPHLKGSSRSMNAEIDANTKRMLQKEKDFAQAQKKYGDPIPDPYEAKRALEKAKAYEKAAENKNLTEAQKSALLAASKSAYSDFNKETLSYSEKFGARDFPTEWSKHLEPEIAAAINQKKPR